MKNMLKELPYVLTNDISLHVLSLVNGAEFGLSVRYNHLMTMTLTVSMRRVKNYLLACV
jgi:hypothetical protein